MLKSRKTYDKISKIIDISLVTAVRYRYIGKVVGIRGKLLQVHFILEIPHPFKNLISAVSLTEPATIDRSIPWETARLKVNDK